MVGCNECLIENHLALGTKYARLNYEIGQLHPHSSTPMNHHQIDNHTSRKTNTHTQSNTHRLTGSIPRRRIDTGTSPMRHAYQHFIGAFDNRSTGLRFQTSNQSDTTIFSFQFGTIQVARWRGLVGVNMTTTIVTTTTPFYHAFGRIILGGAWQRE